MFDLFNGIFGTPSNNDLKKLTEPLATLEARVRDLERVVVITHHDGAGARVNRHAYEKATDEERQQFISAWHKDLEMALFGNLSNSDNGLRIYSLAKQAFDLAQQDAWDHARVYFSAAHKIDYGGWERSQRVVNSILGRMRKEPETSLSANDIESLYQQSEIDITPAVESFSKTRDAKSAIEWLEAWYAFAEQTLTFKGMLPDWFMKQARAGEWKQLLEESGIEKTLPLMDARNKFAEHIKQNDDPHWAANYIRILRCCVWGTGRLTRWWETIQDAQGNRWRIKKRNYANEYMTDDDKQQLVFDSQLEALSYFWQENIHKTYIH